MANQLSLHISRNSIDDKYIEATQIDVDFDIKPDDFSNCESDDEYDVSIVHNKNIIDNFDKFIEKLEELCIYKHEKKKIKNSYDRISKQEIIYEIPISHKVPFFRKADHDYEYGNFEKMELCETDKCLQPIYIDHDTIYLKRNSIIEFNDYWRVFNCNIQYGLSADINFVNHMSGEYSTITIDIDKNDIITHIGIMSSLTEYVTKFKLFLKNKFNKWIFIKEYGKTKQYDKETVFFVGKLCGKQLRIEPTEYFGAPVMRVSTYGQGFNKIKKEYDLNCSNAVSYKITKYLPNVTKSFGDIEPWTLRQTKCKKSKSLGNRNYIEYSCIDDPTF